MVECRLAHGTPLFAYFCDDPGLGIGGEQKRYPPNVFEYEISNYFHPNPNLVVEGLVGAWSL